MSKIEYFVDVDFAKNQLIQAVVENLGTHPTAPRNGQVYYNTTDTTIYGRIGDVWVDLANIYNHPVYAAMNPTLSGASVLANLEVNEEGHVIQANTRILTLGDLGFTGDTNANYFEHPSFTNNDLGAALTGAEIISDVNVNAEGHVTGFVTRNLTASDIGAAVINDSVTNTVNTWSSSKIQAELDLINSTISGALVYIGGYNPSSNTPDLINSSTINKGNTYTITANGNFYEEAVQVGDMIIAEKQDPSALEDWTIINKNIPDIVDATDALKGIIRIATTAEVLEGTNTEAAVTPATLVAFYTANASGEGYAADIGDGSSTSFDITHGLNTKDVFVETYKNVSGITVFTANARVGNSVVRVYVNEPLASNSLRVIIRKR